MEPIRSYRQAGRLAGVNPSSVRAWVLNGRLPPPPWTQEQLTAARNIPTTRPDQRGPRTGHGTVARFAAGCSCTDCRKANRDRARTAAQATAAALLPAAQRARLLDLLATGTLFPVAVAQLGLSPKRIWAQTRAEPDWNQQLTEVLDTHRPTHLKHGTQGAYTAGCRCTDCKWAC